MRTKTVQGTPNKKYRPTAKQEVQGTPKGPFGQYNRLWHAAWSPATSPYSAAGLDGMRARFRTEKARRSRSCESTLRYFPTISRPPLALAPSHSTPSIVPDSLPTNKALARVFKETATLIELTGGNAFRARAFASAARTLERMDESAVELGDDLAAVQGIGKGIGRQHVVEIVQTGTLGTRDDLLEALPEGLPDVLKVKGPGSQKGACAVARTRHHLPRRPGSSRGLGAGREPQGIW